MTPDAAREAQVLLEARRAVQRLVDTLRERARSSAEGDVARLAELAGLEMEDHAKFLLKLLVAAAEGAQEPEGAAWVQHRFHDCVGKAAIALRDAITLSGARHAVAQTLQRKVFEAENALRSALSAPDAPSSAKKARQ
jgi:hypothetical protein